MIQLEHKPACGCWAFHACEAKKRCGALKLKLVFKKIYFAACAHFCVFDGAGEEARCLKQRGIGSGGVLGKDKCE